jgi:hypothetical protein
MVFHDDELVVDVPSGEEVEDDRADPVEDDEVAGSPPDLEPDLIVDLIFEFIDINLSENDDGSKCDQ